MPSLFGPGSPIFTVNSPGGPRVRARVREALGAPSGAIECFIEVPFALGERRLYPDGLIRVSRGAKTWTPLVEVKTGPNQLAAEQLEDYLDIARGHDFDAFITISKRDSCRRRTAPVQG